MKKEPVICLETSRSWGRRMRIIIGIPIGELGEHVIMLGIAEVYRLAVM
jgi:hypothetical protein